MALAAVKVDRTISELAALHGVHPTMIHAWKTQLLDNAEELVQSTRQFEKPPPASAPDGKGGIPPDDPLLLRVQKAYDAMHALCVDLHYRSCSSGVGKPAKTQEGGVPSEPI